MNPCTYCGTSPGLESDHVVPKWRGGTDVPENRVPACRRCNSRKRNRLPSEWRADLPQAVLDIESAAIAAIGGVVKPLETRAATTLISMRLSPEEKTLFEQLADQEGLPTTIWMRLACRRAAGLDAPP